MTTRKPNDQVTGAASALSAYLLWGILPIYWKWLSGATPEEILAHRILWSFVFMMLLLLVTRSLTTLATDVRQLIATPRKALLIVGASVLITVNWYTFIWAVNHGHVIESSLGYYINPLVSVLLGVIFLKEKLSMWQIVSVLVAFLGVLLLTLHTGTFPWVSLVLAVSFGVYGLFKKTVHLGAMTGLAIETSIMTPVAVIFLACFYSAGGHALPLHEARLTWLLLVSGAVTAVPLLLFASGANRIPLSLVGFLQYIAPTIMLILGTFLYHEPFNQQDLVAFILIWVSLALFTVARTRPFAWMEHKLYRGLTLHH
ncbi:EamA family transporter RarD [Alicyclobacillus shizuokensis]|uniref:EamA family transporter RarD n=1 Tax=Alicyclobacillus shizuokensis TaxID=392014 RepID=UPI00082F6F4A|nr:EamA family transporter RarD [Alicyclobacillus shizuokensis]MCL6625749.1 EamA family transporter RarD [Alicyclobacillus shizuokensis]